MDRWQREGLRSANNGMRNQLEDIRYAYEQQQSRLTEVYGQLETLRAQACSPDRAVEVTVDADGVLTDLRLTAAALQGPPEQLSKSIVDAVRTAALRARQRTEELTAPVAAGLADMPDFPDIIPDAPSLDDIRTFFRADQKTSPS
ncbi:YbaB/EbfC family nucleoid-associated protein [Nocardia wallacei]|uniref:YbaB/EbfC family nucleoid-associated protein n=1 Tax=Nocardia wallacei TaxID=480035 RepID=UPI002457133D|nr:YbaB/EbfC family nucleoid-associated protein [Nocardia wallacei]